MRFNRSAKRLALAVGSLVVTLLAARRALAWCPAVTEKIPDSWKQLEECFPGTPGSGALTLFWRNACVTYDLQQDASKKGVSLAQATAVAGRAFARWKNAGCTGGGHPSIDISDLGPVACSAVHYNETQPNQNVIVFRDDAWPYPGDTFNTIGLTRLKFDKDTGEIFDADMELNTADHTLIAEGTPASGEFLLDAVITHEAGHFLGLAHSTDVNAIMYARYVGDAPDLAQDDIDGICAIYPPDGKRTTSGGLVAADICDATPRHGFSGLCESPDGGTLTVTEAPIHRSGCSVSGGEAPRAPAALFGLLGIVFARRRKASASRNRVK